MNDALFQQSGVIPWRVEDDLIRIMVITSRSKGDWILPKGYVEPNMKAWDSAAKEAWEEAGVLGVVSPRIIATSYQDKWHGTAAVEYYSLRIQKISDRWPEMYQRERMWVTEQTYTQVVDRKKLRKVMGRFFEAMKKIAI